MNHQRVEIISKNQSKKMKSHKHKTAWTYNCHIIHILIMDTSHTIVHQSLHVYSCHGNVIGTF